MKGGRRIIGIVSPGLVSLELATVNAIEGFWRHLKCSIAGTHISVSPKHLSRYAKEFEFRFNRPKEAASMFPGLISTFRPLPE
jgi:transposase